MNQKEKSLKVKDTQNLDQEKACNNQSNENNSKVKVFLEMSFPYLEGIT